MKFPRLSRRKFIAAVLLATPDVMVADAKLGFPSLRLCPYSFVMGREGNCVDTNGFGLAQNPHHVRLAEKPAATRNALHLDAGGQRFIFGA